MGLDDLPGMDIPDNKGGRPEKTEEGPNTRAVDGDPFTQHKDEKDWWRVVFNRFVTGDELSIDELAEIADYTHVSPWTVVEKLDQYGIKEMEDGDWRDDYPTDGILGSGTSSTRSSSGGLRSKNPNVSDSENSGLKALLDDNS